MKYSLLLMLMVLTPTAVPLMGCRASGVVSLDDPWHDQYSLIQLANKHAAVLVMRPNEQATFNRASRFDRAGMVVVARTATGHTYFGPIVPHQKHDPQVDDHVAGTAGEFGMRSPLGYEQSDAGQGFVKIGVGTLRRVDDKPYFFREDYQLVGAGRWRMEADDDCVTMTHTLEGPRGWGYVYRTQVRLLGNRPGFVIERRLTNIGKRPIVTDYYSHNFFVLDERAVSPAYELTLLPEHEVAKGRTVAPWIRFEGDRLRLTQELPRGKALFLPLRYDTTPSQPWRVKLTQGSGATVTLHHQPAPDRVVIYVKRPYLSVEPFIDIKIKPDESHTWVARYELE